MEKILDLPKDEMAFRKVYKDLLESESLTTVFRPGRRINGNFRSYLLGQEVKAKILDKVGADWAEVPPKFVEGFEKKIRIVGIEAKKLCDFKKSDFLGSSPDVRDISSLKYHLGVIYNKGLSELGDESYVTKIQFDYLVD